MNWKQSKHCDVGLLVNLTFIVIKAFIIVDYKTHEKNVL